MTNILHITRTLTRGGAEGVAALISTSPLLRNYKFSRIYTLNNKEGIYENKNSHENDYLCEYPKSSFICNFSYRLDRLYRQISFSIRAFSMILRLKPDIIHIHTPDQFGLVFLNLAKRLKIPSVLTIHQMGVKDQRFIDNFIDYSQKNNKYFVTIVSSAVLKTSGLAGVLPIKNTRIIYNGIDLEKYSDNGIFDSQWRTKNQIPKRAFVFGTCGRIIQLKRFDLFIESAKLIIDQGKIAHFVLVGNGDPNLENQLRNRVLEYGLAKFFHFLPWQPDIRDFLANINTYVQCSDSEGFSLSLLEACAMGLPSIATSVGGIPEIFEGVINLIDPGSSIILAEAMEKLMFSDNLHNQSIQCKKLAKNYSSEKMAQQYKTVYQELLDSN